MFFKKEAKKKNDEQAYKTARYEKKKYKNLQTYHTVKIPSTPYRTYVYCIFPDYIYTV